MVQYKGKYGFFIFVFKYTIIGHVNQKIDYYRYCNAGLDGLHPSFKIDSSILLAGPPVNALAKRAYPHDCGVWLGREPEE
jgi:hypothetical protein